MENIKITKAEIKKRVKDIESLSIEEWSAKYPDYYQWLLDNGFRYRECYDKNRMKKLKSLSKTQANPKDLSANSSSKKDCEDTPIFESDGYYKKRRYGK